MQEPISPEIQDGTLLVRILEEDGVCTLSVVGELDLANVATLAAQLEQRTAGNLVLDMSELEFIDSTGIALLVATHRRLNGDGAVKFKLVGSRSPSVRRVMALTGLDTELPFSGDGHLEPDPGTA
jgi:anti-sigma B factor antagonist